MTVAIGRRFFEGPHDNVSDVADEAGVYVVVCKEPDGGFFLVDVGESDQLRTRLASHDRKDCWARVCAARYQVAQFGVLYTPRIPAHYRHAIEQEIRKQYQPPCGEV